MDADTIHLIRLVSPWVGILAAMLLAYRTVATWPHLSVLTRLLAGTLGLVMVVQSYGSTRALSTNVTPLDDVVVVLFVTRLAVVCLAIVWPWRR